MNYSDAVIVIPTYNERENVALMADAVLRAAPGARLLFVDDNSPDGTGELIDSLAAKSSGRVSCLHRQAKEGLGRA